MNVDVEIPSTPLTVDQGKKLISTAENCMEMIEADKNHEAFSLIMFLMATIEQMQKDFSQRQKIPPPIIKALSLPGITVKRVISMYYKSQIQ